MLKALDNSRFHLGINTICRPQKWEQRGSTIRKDLTNNKHMKEITTLKNNYFFSGLRLCKDIYKHSTMIVLSNEPHLKVVSKKIGRILITSIFLRTNKFISKLRLVHNFTVKIIHMNKHHGSTMTILYLKACQLAIQKKIAGNPLTSLRELHDNLPLPRLSTSGLPM